MTVRVSLSKSRLEDYSLVMPRCPSLAPGTLESQGEEEGWENFGPLKGKSGSHTIVRPICGLPKIIGSILFSLCHLFSLFCFSLGLL